MIFVLLCYAASIIASVGLSFLFVGVILEKSNSFGSNKESVSCMKKFKLTDASQTPKL